MGHPESGRGNLGKWMALTAALLGWMFDGLEMGLFSLVGRPALMDLYGIAPTSTGAAAGLPGKLITGPVEAQVNLTFGITIACFLVGAATGGVLFGWLGDRIGRVRAMTLSVFTYAVFSGLGGLTTAAWQVAVLRFVAALGMGGEWALGVALVMELWPGASRGLLAGLIGAAGNLGYMLIAVIGLGLSAFLEPVRDGLLSAGLTEEWAAWLVRNRGWRLVMLCGALPALLTFFIRLFVPESERWVHAKGQGATAHWTNGDLVGVALGAAAGVGIIGLWATDLGLPPAASYPVRGVLTLVLFVGAMAGFLGPAMRYLKRRWPDAPASDPRVRGPLVRLLLGATLSGIPLLGTWASIQWGPAWTGWLSGHPEAGYYTQFSAALGAVLGCILGAMLGDWFGRRPTYVGLCLLALATSLVFFLTNSKETWAWDNYYFWVTAFLAGGVSAAFYGWLPLYLPELFPTYIRATGQGFSFNLGRVIAAVGALQMGNLVALFGGNHAVPCSIMASIYVVGVVVIWLAPETRGKPLPE